jgi:hypothetical protein
MINFDAVVGVAQLAERRSVAWMLSHQVVCYQRL